MDYWAWLFDSPFLYVPYGAYCKDTGQLIAFYSALMVGKDYGVCYSAMVRPEFRGRQLIQKVASAVYNDVKLNEGKYVYLFANKNIRHIYKKYLGFREVFQIKEYFLKYDKFNVNQFQKYFPIFNRFSKWRYKNHPLHQNEHNKYMYYYKPFTRDLMVFSTYKDRIQIVDYTNLNDAIQIGSFIAHVLKRSGLTFWSEEDLDYKFKYLPTWKMYKKLDQQIDLDKIIKSDRLRMAQSDVF